MVIAWLNTTKMVVFRIERLLRDVKVSVFWQCPFAIWTFTKTRSRVSCIWHKSMRFQKRIFPVYTPGMIGKADVTYCVDRLVELCGTPSPSGFTAAVEKYLVDTLGALGLKTAQTRKRSVVCDLGGVGSPLLLAAHVDTLGAMVRSLKANARVRYTKIGSYPELYLTAETCVLHTREGRRFTGTFQPVNPAVHVNKKLGEMKFDDETMEVVLDVIAEKTEELEELGVAAGDFISIDPRIAVTETGFIKSRHLDDKASAAVLLTLASLVSSGRLEPRRKVYLLFTTYEEVGHGGSSGIPEDVEEIISVDMGAIGDDLTANERMVSICAKDSGGPYNYAVTNGLIAAAKESGASYAVDIYPFYGSDVEASLRAGYDVTHGLIGPGVSASHGYERTHREGLENTLKLLANYIG
jgi:putative aminopeptidase FrvX